MESDVVDTFPIQIEFDVEMIATQRIMADGVMACLIERAIIARLFIVIENDLLIKRFVVHYVKTFCTVRMPEIIVSTSAMVL